VLGLPRQQGDLGALSAHGALTFFNQNAVDMKLR